jgi:hypothetical protein
MIDGFICMTNNQFITSRRLFIYLFIRHDGMSWPFRKTDKMFRERKNERPEVMPSSPIKQVQNAKRECGTAMQQIQ